MLDKIYELKSEIKVARDKRGVDMLEYSYPTGSVTTSIVGDMSILYNEAAQRVFLIFCTRLDRCLRLKIFNIQQPA